MNAKPGQVKDLSVKAAEEAAAVGTKGFGCDMVLDRWDAEWTRNAAGGGGHYVYPVHPSHATMRANSLPAALYLTLLRFLARRYVDVVKLSDLCVSESAPTPEVAQLWHAFAGVANDPAPDATAARLALSAAAFNTPAEALLPWETYHELANYVSTWRHVSASCRAPPDEERVLLDGYSTEVEKVPLLANRASYLYMRSGAPEDAVVGHPKLDDGGGGIGGATTSGASSPVCPLAYPEAPAHGAFDTVDDRSCLEEGVSGEGPLGRLASLTTNFPTFEEKDLIGEAGLKKVGEWIEAGSLALDGAHGFPLLYELLNSTVPLRIIPTDDPFRWGTALIRFVPPEQSMKRGTLMSMLRILSSSPYLAKQAPKVEERGMGAKFAAVFTSDGSIGQLIKRVQPYLRDKARGIGGLPPSTAAQWQQRGAMYSPPGEVAVPDRAGPRGVAKDAARWALPTFPNAACGRRRFPLAHHLGGTAGPWGGPNLNAVDLASLVDQPLAQLPLDRYFETAAGAGDSIDVEAARMAKCLDDADPAMVGSMAGLPFSVGQHAAAATPIARATLMRLKTDVRAAVDAAKGAHDAKGASTDRFARAHLKHLSPSDAIAIAEEATSAAESGADHAKLEAAGFGIGGAKTTAAKNFLLAVLKDIRQLIAKDQAAATEAAAAATSTANGLSRDPSAARGMLRLGLNRRSGAWAETTFDDLIEGLLCDGGEKILARITPGVTERNAAEALHLAAEALLLTSRAAHAAKAAAAAEDAIKAVTTAAKTIAAAATPTAGKEACVFGVSLAAKALADLLRTRRYYFDVEQPGDKMMSGDFGGMSVRTYDPRMLVFEYAQILILRERQVGLVRDFTNAANSGGAECAQMLMGEGKTTVVCPLLGFMLATKDMLVCQVVPQSLLEFSRGCLRSAFAGVVRRSVLTLRFDRFTPLTPAPLLALRKAKSARAIVVTTPTALKSLCLKYLECAHLLDQSYVATIEGKQVGDTLGTFGRLFEGASEYRSRSERVSEAGGLAPAEIVALRKEGAIAGEMMKLFQRSGTLILDEVDLILHPLKSELHWPLGRRVPLDFSKSRSGDGLRWKLPFFLLDAIFATALRRPAAEEAKGSNDAAAILQKVAAAVRDAVKNKGVQSTPHVVLLDRQWYGDTLMPLLAEWAELWLRVHGAARGIADHHMHAYLCRTKGAADAARVIEKEAEDESLKMINLARDWLTALLPHVLSKINRVSYGLLSAKDVKLLEEANGGMRVPTNRRLLAVPFLGKDIPSQTNEFSHPDVVIGLTICTYRHEGLRRGDFRQVLRSLLEQLETETGPQGKRPSAKKWANFVRYTGRRVRGEAREEAAAAARRTGASLKATTTAIGASRAVIASHSRSSSSLSGSLYSLKDAAANEATAKDEDAKARAQAAAALLAAAESEVWPLQLVDLRDADQVEELYQLLRMTPEVIDFYLNDFIFPKTARHQGLKLSATGQELGGDLVFPRRLGFSGTPADLLPLELGTPKFELGTDAKVLATLTDHDVVATREIPPGWDVLSLLRTIAAADPPIHALVDTGALITNLSNLSVARFLLENGLKWAEGVVFLDEGDRQMVLMRKGWAVTPLARVAALDKSKRFSFYDQGAHDGDGHQASPGRARGADAREGHDAARLRPRRVAHATNRPRAASRAVHRPRGEEARRVRGGGGGGAHGERARGGCGQDGRVGARATKAEGRARVARRERHARGERSGGVARGAARGEHMEEARVQKLAEARRGRVWRRSRREERAEIFGRLSRARRVRRLERRAERVVRVEAPRARGQRALRAVDRRRESVAGAAGHPARRRRDGGVDGGVAREAPRRLWLRLRLRLRRRGSHRSPRVRGGKRRTRTSARRRRTITRKAASAASATASARSTASKSRSKSKSRNRSRSKSKRRRKRRRKRSTRRSSRSSSTAATTRRRLGGEWTRCVTSRRRTLRGSTRSPSSSCIAASRTRRQRRSRFRITCTSRRIILKPGGR